MTVSSHTFIYYRVIPEYRERNKSYFLPKCMVGVFLEERKEDNDFNLLHKEKKRSHAHVCTQKHSFDRVCPPWDLGDRAYILNEQHWTSPETSAEF